MARNWLVIVFLVIPILTIGCSERNSSARISFKDSIAPASVFGPETRINAFGSDEEVIRALKGEIVDYSPRKSYTFLYENPTIAASTQCLESPAAAKKEFQSVVDQLGDKHPLGLKAHTDLKMKLPAIGFWNDDPGSAKQIIFRYGNVLVVIQTMFSSDAPVKSIQAFADTYVRHLDSVSGRK